VWRYSLNLIRLRMLLIVVFALGSVGVFAWLGTLSLTKVVTLIGITTPLLLYYRIRYRFVWFLNKGF
jgi:hypothetical protein